MAKWKKTLARMRENPRDWRIGDLEALATRFNIDFRKPGTSHATFSHPDVAEILTVPMDRPIKPKYIKDFLALMDEVMPADVKDHDE